MSRKQVSKECAFLSREKRDLPQLQSKLSKPSAKDSTVLTGFSLSLTEYRVEHGELPSQKEHLCTITNSSTGGDSKRC